MLSFITSKLLQVITLLVHYSECLSILLFLHQYMQSHLFTGLPSFNILLIYVRKGLRYSESPTPNLQYSLCFSFFVVFVLCFVYSFLFFFPFFFPRYLSFTDDLTEIEFSWKESEQAFKHYKEKQVRNVEVCGGNNIIVDSSNCGHPQYSEFISVVARVVKIRRMQREISVPSTVASGLHPGGNDVCIYMQLNGVNNKERR